MFFSHRGAHFRAPSTPRTAPCAVPLYLVSTARCAAVQHPYCTKLCSTAQHYTALHSTKPHQTAHTLCLLDSPGSPSNLLRDGCPATCFGENCDFWIASTTGGDNESCESLESNSGCDCTGCSCGGTLHHTQNGGPHGRNKPQHPIHPAPHLVL